tara:strand:- start:207 stop:1214 length:1008 start_codon:yes stop_codon:yes gene_type:complete
MGKIALITGITGQDGSYLAEFLIKKKYKIIGTFSTKKPNLNKINKLNLKKKIIFEKLNINNSSQISKLLKKYKINEFYNLASQSYVDKSFKHPLKTTKINALGVLQILEEIKNRKLKIKFYQASSSEMFGNSKSNKQSEKTRFDPESPYAISKLFSHYITLYYRKTHKLFAVSGILFNHESPLRQSKFVISKIINGLIKVKKKEKVIIELGNINIKRDWGYSKEYVVQMWKMLQTRNPDDYIIATGESHSLKDLINYATAYLNIKTKWIGKGLKTKLINLENDKVIVKINKKFFRPSDIKSTKGNISKAKKNLKWKPKVNLKKLIKILIDEKLKK